MPITGLKTIRVKRPGVELDAAEKEYSRSLSLLHRFIGMVDSHDANRAIDGKRRLVKESEILLRYSTCRNHYMFVNALFQDIWLLYYRPTVLLSKLLETSRRQSGDYSSWRDKVGELVASAKQKQRVWHDRERIDEKLSTLIDSIDGFGEMDRDELRKIFSGTGSQIEGFDSYDSRVICVQQDEEPQLLKLENLLSEALQYAAVCRQIAMAVADVSKPADRTLFEPPPKSSKRPTNWTDLYHCLKQNSAAIGACTTGDGIAVAKGDYGALQVVLKEDTTNWDGVTELLRLAVGQVEYMISRLESSFEPNRPKFALPAIFKISLPLPSTSRSIPNVRVGRTVLPLHLSPRGNFTVAIPGFGFPYGWYERHICAFNSQCRGNAEVAISAFLQSLDDSAEQIDAIVFPEYFVPRGCRDRISQFAAKKGVVAIYGLEASHVTIDGDTRIQNSAVVDFSAYPGALAGGKKIHTVDKVFPSQFESKLAPSDGVTVFRDSPIGTFAVCICSDLLEHSVVQSMHEAGVALNAVFVVSMNPSPGVFVPLAISDAMRLYAPILVCNNCINIAEGKAHAATCDGSGLAAPFWKSPASSSPKQTSFGDYFHAADGRINIDAPLDFIPAADRCIYTYAIPYASIAAAITNYKTRGLLNPPNSRTPIN